MSQSTTTYQRPRAARRPIVMKTSFSDDEDAITPCSSPPPEPQEPCTHQRHILTRTGSKSTANSPKASSSQQSWHFDPTHGKDMSDSELWRRMLDIQRHFHCYNSARMSAALLELEMGVDAGHFAPSRSCLDLMNESVSEMSVEERQRLADWLEDNTLRRRRSAIWKRAAVFD